MRHWLAKVVAALLALMAAASADDALIQSLNAGPHGPPFPLACAQYTEAPFRLPDEPGRPVCLYLQAILKYRALSHSAGVLRFSVNGQELAPEQSVNKAGEYWASGKDAYAARAFALPAQPAFESGDREDLGGLGYLFDITGLVKAGDNTLRITHVAATDVALLRDLTVVAGGQAMPIQLGAARMDPNDPGKLQWDFAPNIMEQKGLFLCQGAVQPVRFFVRNQDTAGAAQVGLALELPPAIEIAVHYLPYADGWTERIKINTSTQQRAEGPVRRHEVRLPEEAAVPPETAWHSFGGYPLVLYLRCGAEPGQYAMRWQSLSQGGEGGVSSAPVTVLPPLPEAPQPRRSRLGVWAYRTVQPGKSPGEQELAARLRADTDAQLARLGVSRLVLSDAAEIPEARRNGLLVSLASPWSFNRTVYPTDTQDPANARHDAQGNLIFTDRRSGACQWCPTYAAEHGAEVFGLITERIREEEWDGFDLDHEGVHQQCFCDRCRTAFCQRAGLAAPQLKWPADVLPEGRLHEQWVRFHVWNVGRHVRQIREAVKAGNPDALLFCWFTMSLYEYEPTGPHVPVYEKRLREGFEIGYDLREFLECFDYANMANGVYPHDESTWDYEYGLTWAFNRVEATVDNPWHVPLAPCLNIGGGDIRSWTNPEYLRWQAKTHLAQGVRGLDFWMLPFFDGRHHTLLSQLARILSATQDIIWEGSRADEQVTVSGPDTIFRRAFVGRGKLLAAITNRGLEPATVTIRVPGGARDGRTVVEGSPVADRLSVPPLDGVFIVYDLD